MKLGYIGLGKMGSNMTLRLLEYGHDVVAFDKNTEAMQEVADAGADTAGSLEELVSSLDMPRTVWIMVPWQAVDSVLEGLTPHLSEGDVVIDGGNSPYSDSKRRFAELQRQGIHFLDVGVSGGPGGARNGACMMIGGERNVYEKHEDLFRHLTVENGYGYFGPAGAGHFVKMVHNGIEYGMMQAIAEGFTVMHDTDEYDIDLRQVADVYNNGSVIESRLVRLARDGFAEYGQDLEQVKGSVGHSGEAKWAIEAAQRYCEEARKVCSIPVTEASLQFRVDSEEHPSYTGKILSMLRNMFGGHKATK